MTSVCPAATDECLSAARSALEIEADAIRLAGERLDGNMIRAVDLIIRCAGKVVVTGVGKSGHIGHKIAATLCSTGTPAVFMHPADATHGDLGIYTPGDPTILISRSGATLELVSLVPLLRRLKSPLIGILGNLNAPLAREADVLLDARISREADPLNLAPTCSSTVALALGDALSAALMQARQFSHADFALFHPSGQLGRNMRLTVEESMHTGDHVAWVRPLDSLRHVVIAMTQRPLGAACVVDDEMRLAGLITDGDLRRALQNHDDIRSLAARDVMTEEPVSVGPAASLRQAASLMENRTSQISVLPVVDSVGICIGLLRAHDVYSARQL